MRHSERLERCLHCSILYDIRAEQEILATSKEGKGYLALLVFEFDILSEDAFELGKLTDEKVPPTPFDLC